ncbi:hypothetical protein MH117_15035 [Paenibacillus sp. ACRRX]|uniref:hypothetical protein n=1 Tax=unclassified Paenibacillus TaxID=185978 RepID=UPI001EF72DCF|nr:MULTISPECIES: hypothetical protein [unclassified Paenibacillus]MCG7408745.1 hypothetical protein [Paenibacillus sp. ACRRX]MDK8183514.1 hypothetical protein [Paenibacillus sp. UMB4589-SE434]
MSKVQRKTRTREGSNRVNVKQSASASTGQGGNAFAINASDVGVVRTDIRPKK